MTEIFATLELTKVEVESLYFILRRVGGLGRTRMAADRIKRAIEDVHSFEPKDSRAGNPFPAPYELRNVRGGVVGLMEGRCIHGGITIPATSRAGFIGTKAALTVSGARIGANHDRIQ